MQPRWFIWENVPGVLSSNKGKDFEVIINEMVKSGYGVCWRVLDARWFGLPQSRPRLFVVGRFGSECPTEVLFESQDTQDAPGKYEERQQADTIRHQGLDVIPICMRGRRSGVVMEYMDFFGCLRADIGSLARDYVWDNKGVRQLTPLECERLQGMPDNHTSLGYDTPDRLRWKAIGNSMAVPVVRWIGNKIAETMTISAPPKGGDNPESSADVEVATVGVPPSQKEVRSLNNFTKREDNQMNFVRTTAPIQFPDNEPNEKSSLDQLAIYALNKQEAIILRDIQNAEDLWLMGQAMEWAFKKTPYGEWEKWCKAKGFRKTYVWQARTLHERAELEQVNALGLTEALRKFKVIPEKKAKADTATEADVVSKEQDHIKALPDSVEDASEPSSGNLAEGNEQPSNSVPEPESAEQPIDQQAEEDEPGEIKAVKNGFGKQTPKTRAVVILHALESLLDDLNGQEIDEELQQTFCQIAEVAREMKVSRHVELKQAA